MSPDTCIQVDVPHLTQRNDCTRRIIGGIIGEKVVPFHKVDRMSTRKQR